jgi:hypothetical protein
MRREDAKSAEADAKEKKEKKIKRMKQRWASAHSAPVPARLLSFSALRVFAALSSPRRESYTARLARSDKIREEPGVGAVEEPNRPAALYVP